MRLKIEAELDYKTKGERTALLQIEAAETADQHLARSKLDVEDPVSLTRVPAEEGVGLRAWLRVRDRLVCTYSAEVEIDREAPPLGNLAATPPHELPGEVVKFLMPSRFCHSDLFAEVVEAEFAGLEGGARAAAMRDWIEESLDYVRGSSDARTTALDTYVKRQGICRDYAHLMVTFARASYIPARMVSVYAPDVKPPDFHAVAELYLDGDWRLVDATGMAAPGTMARIGVGRDAADVAFLAIYGGPCELCNQKVRVSRA